MNIYIYLYTYTIYIIYLCLSEFSPTETLRIKINVVNFKIFEQNKRHFLPKINLLVIFPLGFLVLIVIFREDSNLRD